MKFDVYCDESRPDLFSSASPPAIYLVIGSLWAHREDRDALKTAIHALRNKHRVGAEFKWQKVSASRMPFYEELVTLFFSAGDRLHFRCIAVDHTKVDLGKYHKDDQELGFYKFYYQLLHHWILDFNEYAIFCDHKQNRDMRRLHALHRCLANTNLSATIASVQAIPSDESVMVQFADLLTGAAAASLNKSLTPGSDRQCLAAFLASKLGRPVAPTWKSEPKFNVFAIDLKGGW